MTSAALPLSDGRAVWTELRKVTEFGHPPEQVFEDWLDLSLAAHLSVTDNIIRKGVRPGRLDGQYEERTARIVSRYPEPRAIVAFDAAYDLLARVVCARGVDALGDIYHRYVARQARAQCIAPAPVQRDDVVASSPSRKADRLLDYPCGSGRALIAAHGLRPDAELWGIDADAVRAKMCAVNMLVFGFRAGVIHGSLANHEYFSLWRMRSGFVAETVIEEQVGDKRAELVERAIPHAELSASSASGSCSS